MEWMPTSVRGGRLSGQTKASASSSAPKLGDRMAEPSSWRELTWYLGADLETAEGTWREVPEVEGPPGVVRVSGVADVAHRLDHRLPQGQLGVVVGSLQLDGGLNGQPA